MKLSKEQESFIKGYAKAIQDTMIALTGDNTCGKNYDPCEFKDDAIYSYAFDLKDGGRVHPLSDYKTIEEIIGLMLKEGTEFIQENLPH